VTHAALYIKIFSAQHVLVCLFTKMHAPRKAYVIIEESGEYEGRDWRIVRVGSSEDDALRRAWKMAFANWANHYYVQEWDVDATGASLRSHDLDSWALRKTYVSQTLNDIELELDAFPSGLPQRLSEFTRVRE